MAVESGAAVAAIVPSLLDRSRFDGHRVTFVSDPAAARALGPSLLIVDIDRVDDLASCRLDACRVVGYGSHVDAERQEAARRAGFEVVVARSVMFGRLGDLLAGGTGFGSTGFGSTRFGSTGFGSTG
jgi:hypothetical protein